VFDDGDWVAGIFDCVEGEMPSLPWDAGALSAALGALDQLAMIDAPISFPAAAARLGPLFDGWRQLAGTGRLPSRWVTRKLDELIAFERHALTAVRGNRLVHADVRADNIMFTAGGVVVFVDWAHACAGPPWLDAVMWLPALQLEGAGLLEENILRVPSIRGGDPDAITAVLVACAGYFVHAGTLADPPGLPTLRAFQRAQGEVALAGLERRLG
jgi:aminoglycoside phosphotransferase (APT) family kinase protein